MSKEGLFGFGVPPYYARILEAGGHQHNPRGLPQSDHGFTGQFSIGHTGFMAVGAYSSTYMTVYHTQGWEVPLAGIIGEGPAQHLIFPLAIIVGALAAAVAGLIVGIPSLRLRGDYLAIVTLGFAEIIRIVIMNIDKVGGATGFRSRGYYEYSCGSAAFAVITVPGRSRQHREFGHGPRVRLDSRRRTRGRGDGHQHDALQSDRRS